MFWSKKKKDKKKKKQAPSVELSPEERSKQLREQAMANARAAKEHIGEETLQKIAAAMTKKQQSALEQAKKDIHSADPDKVLDELKFMMDNREKLD